MKMFLLISLGLFCQNSHSLEDKLFSEKPNIILIAIDTLRPDHLSAYGYHKLTSPNIDRLAKAGSLFTSAYSQSNWSLHSFASLMSGKYPRSIGMLDEGKKLFHKKAEAPGCKYIDPKINDREFLISELLKKSGYRTFGIFSGNFTQARYGFNQGFDFFLNRRTFNKSIGPTGLHEKILLKDQIPMALKWVNDSNSSKPFFIFLNSQDTNEPFYIQTNYSQKSKTPTKQDQLSKLWEKDNIRRRMWASDAKPVLNTNEQKILLQNNHLKSLRDRYDSAISSVDLAVGSLIASIEKSGLDQNTIVIFLSDHGEGLGDHGPVCHCTWPPMLNEELIRVPLIIKFPKKISALNKRIINQPVELVDILPTILEITSSKALAPDDIQGKSLIETMKSTSNHLANRSVYAETKGYGVSVKSIRKGAWKLIATSSEIPVGLKIELFNLQEDPKETRDMSLKFPSMVNMLMEELNVWEKQNQALYIKRHSS